MEFVRYEHSMVEMPVALEHALLDGSRCMLHGRGVQTLFLRSSHRRRVFWSRCLHGSRNNPVRLSSLVELHARVRRQNYCWKHGVEFCFQSSSKRGSRYVYCAPPAGLSLRPPPLTALAPRRIVASRIHATVERDASFLSS